MTLVADQEPQHMVAFRKAQRVRLERAAVRRWIAEPEETTASRERLVTVLLDPCEEVHTMRVYDLLRAARRTGRQLALRQLRAAAVSEFRNVGSLTLRERLILAEILKAPGRLPERADVDRRVSIVVPLWAAGLRTAALETWWTTMRRELAWLTPRDALRFDARQVLALAKRDAAELEAALARRAAS